MSHEDIIRPPAEQTALDERTKGSRRNGSVFIREFDEGVVRTLGAVLIGEPDHQEYYLVIPNVSPPPGFPGVIVTFAHPEDVFAKNYLPAVVVRRDDITAAMRRFHLGGEAYSAPADGALPISRMIPGVGTRTGWDKTEIRMQAEPNDLLYTVEIFCRSRGGVSGKREANEILRWVLSRFNAYFALEVVDDIGDFRTYDGFREGISMLDDLADVAERVIGYAVTLRIEAELDISIPSTYRTVTTVPELGVGGSITVGPKK